MFPDVQVATLPEGPLVQSPATQQVELLLGMQAPVPVQVLNVGPTQVQTPAPVHVRFPPQDEGAGGTQLPTEQVPKPTLLTPEQVRLPHWVVVGG